MGDILWWTRMGPGFVTLSLSSLAAPGPGLYRTRSASPPRPPPTAVARAPRSLRSRSKTWSGVIFMNKEIPHPQVRLHRSVYNTPWARIQGLEQEGAQPCRRKCVASAAACPAALAAGGGKSGGGSRAVRLAGHGTSSFGAQTCGTCAELPTLPIQTLSPRSGGRSRGELVYRSVQTLDTGCRVQSPERGRRCRSARRPARGAAEPLARPRPARRGLRALPPPRRRSPPACTRTARPGRGRLDSSERGGPEPPERSIWVAAWVVLAIATT
jgi:hypothetical protein